MDGVPAFGPPAGQSAGNTTLGILPLLLGGGSLGTTLRYASLRPRDRRCMNRTFQTIEPMMCSRFRDGDGRFDSYSPSNSGNTIEMPSVIHTIPGVKSEKAITTAVAGRRMQGRRNPQPQVPALVLRSRGRHQVERGSHNATDEGRHSGNPPTVHTLGSVHFHKDNLRHLS